MLLTTPISTDLATQAPFLYMDNANPALAIAVANAAAAAAATNTNDNFLNGGILAATAAASGGILLSLL